MMKREGRWMLRNAAVAAMAALACASLASAGYYWESVTLTEGQKGKQREQMVVRGWVDGPKAKIEFESGDKQGPFAEGSYWVTTDAGETIYWVDPEEKTYAEFDLEKLMTTMGQMMDMMGGMMKFEITDVASEKLAEEAGGSMLGHPTTHYRFESGYNMKMKIMGMGQEQRIDMLQDVWVTDALDARGLGVWLRPDRALKTGNEEFDKLIDSQFRDMKGFPLKSVVVTTTTNKKGKSQQQTSTTEVRELREESVADTSFTVPAGYTQTELIPGMAQIGGQEGGGEKEKKGGLSGLFGRGKKDDG